MLKITFIRTMCVAKPMMQHCAIVYIGYINEEEAAKKVGSNCRIMLTNPATTVLRT